ncbi:hypothetical protein [Pseudoalteromonas sp. MMG005]|nr:hypothetical protein [Pseudoalteromonas sp. MMG005]MBQ4845249.1 hypothetical protein [Pseudoalteromonas sp. MMG005]
MGPEASSGRRRWGKGDEDGGSVTGSLEIARMSQSPRSCVHCHAGSLGDE